MYKDIREDTELLEKIETYKQILIERGEYNPEDYKGFNGAGLFPSHIIQAEDGYIIAGFYSRKEAVEFKVFTRQRNIGNDWRIVATGVDEGDPRSLFDNILKRIEDEEAN